MIFFHRSQRQSEIVLTEAHCCHCRLNRDGIDFAEECANEIVVFALQCSAACDVTVEETGTDFARLCRQDIGENGNAAGAAHG